MSKPSRSSWFRFGTVFCACVLVSAVALAQSTSLTTLVTNQDTLPLTNRFSLVFGTMNGNGDYVVAPNSQALFYRPLDGTLTRIVQNGETLPAPATGQVDIITSFRINDNRIVAATADLSNSSVPFFRRALFTYDGSTIQTLVMSTDAAPGASGYSIGRAINLVGINSSGDIAFTSVPSAGAVTLGTTLYIRTAAGTIVRAVGVGDSAPGTGGTFFNISPVIGATTLPNLNARGEVLFSASINGGNGGAGLFVASVSGVRKVVANGDSNPLGGTFSITSAPTSRQNQAGQVAFIANGQVWICDANGTLSKIAASGDLAPANLGGSLNAITTTALSMNDNGMVAFFSSTTGDVNNGNVNYGGVLMTTTAGVQPQAVAWGGETVPTVGGVFSSFNASYNVNNSGQVAFFGNVTGGSAARGFFVGSGGSSPTPTVLEGTSLPFSPSGTATFANGLNVLSGSTILADGSIFVSANIQNSSTDDYAEFINHPNATYSTLLADGTSLPAGANVTLRTFYTASAGDWVTFIGSYAGGALSYFARNVATGTTYRVVGDGDTVGGFPVRVENINTVFVNSSGKVLFGDQAVGGPLFLYVWDPGTPTITKVAQSGSLDPVSGLSFTSITAMAGLAPTPMNGAGTVLFNACVNSSTTSCGVYAASAGGPITRVVFDGDSAPGGGAFSTPRGIAINDVGQVVFLSGTGANGGYYIYTPGAGISKIAAVGDSFAGPDGGTFSSFPFVSNFAPQGGSLNNAGQFAFGAAVSGGTATSGYFVGSAQASPFPVALSSDATPAGGTFANLNKLDVVINDAHDVAFRADISGGAADSGYFIVHDAGSSTLSSPQAVLVQGQTVPGGSDTFDRQSTTPNNINGDFFTFDSQRNLYVFATVLTSGNANLQLFRYLPGGTLESAAARGDSIPGTGGVAASYSPHPPMNAKHMAFWAPIVGGTANHAIVAFLGDTTAANADMGVTVSSGERTPAQTASQSYTFTAINHGSATATGASLTIDIPAGVTVTYPGNCSGTGPVTCTLGDLGVGAVAQVALTATLDTAGVKTFTGTVSSAVVDPNAANNSDSVTTSVANRILVSIGHLPEPAAHGSIVTYQVMVTNETGSITDSTTSLSLPSGASYVAASSSPACSSAAPPLVTCSSGPLGANGSASFTIAFTAPPAGSYPMTASVSAGPAGDGTAQDTLNVSAASDLSTSGAAPGTATGGSTVTFTTTVTNNGPDPADVTVNATLPPDFIFVSANYSNVPGASSGPCSLSAGQIVCAIGNMPYSGSPTTATVTVTATASARLGFFSLGATASSANIDPVPLNNSSNAPVLIALSGSAQDALLFPESTQGTFAIFGTSLTPITTEPPVFTSQGRYGPVVLPNGRIAFAPRSASISVVDLSLKAEIRRIPVAVNYPLVLSPDGSKLVAVLNDTINIIDTTTFQYTTVNLNGLVGDDPTKSNDIVAGAPAIVGHTAYFNPTGLINGSLTDGIPLIAVDLDTNSVSTIALPTTARGTQVGFELVRLTIAATPDGRYVVAARADGTVIYDLNSSSVVARETTVTSPRLVATPRDAGNPNMFAYEVTSSGVLSVIDLRTGSSTFGSIIATANSATPDPYFSSPSIQSSSILVSGDGSKVITTDEGGTITTVDTRLLLTNPASAAVNATTYPSQFDFNGIFGAAIDLTPVSGAPTVTSVSPNSMTSDTPTLLNISGTNFTAGAVVRVGLASTPLASTFISSTQLQVTVPAGQTTGSNLNIVVTVPNSGSFQQQNASGILAGAFTISPPGSFSLSDKLVAVTGSDAVVSVNPASAPTYLPQPPFHFSVGNLAFTSDGAYAFVPIYPDGIDVVNLASGTHTIHAFSIDFSSAFVVRSNDSTTLAPVMYFSDAHSLVALDGNPASGNFGNVISTTLSGLAPGTTTADSMAVTPSGRYVYVAALASTLTPARQLLIFDTTVTTSRAANIGLTTLGAAASQFSMFVTPDGKYLGLTMADAAQIGLFSLANPTAPVLTNTLVAAVPSGYSSVSLSDYTVFRDRLYALGTATASDGSSHPVLEIFSYDPATNNFGQLSTYINDNMAIGPMRVSSDGSRLYVTNAGGDFVQVLDITKVRFADPTAPIVNLGAPFGAEYIDVPYSAAAPAYDLALSMTHTPEPAARGGQASVVLTVTNKQSSVSNVSVMIPSPGAGFLATTPFCSLSGANVVCTFGSLASGQTVSTAVSLSLASTVGSLPLSATVSSTETSVNGDANPSDNTATDSITIANGANLVLQASPTTLYATGNSGVSFNASVTNTGLDATSATVVATAPAGFALSSGSFTNPNTSASGACSVAGAQVTCNVGNIPPGGSAASITFNGQVGTTLGWNSFAVTVTGTTAESTTLDNSAAVAVNVGVSSNAQEMIVVDDNATAGLKFLSASNPSTQIAAIPQLMSQPRLRMAVLPNGRLGFTGSSYISVVDLAIGAEIARLDTVPSAAYSLNADGSTLVVPSGDTAVLVDTATLQRTTIDLNGSATDDPSKADLTLGVPAIVGNKAYFNPSGLRQGSSTVGLPLIVVDLTTHAVSTIAMPTTSRGASGSYEASTLAGTANGHYLIALRRDGYVVVDLTTNTVALRNPLITSNFDMGVVTARSASDPNVFAYILTTSPRRFYKIDMRTGSPTFGQILSYSNSASPADENGRSLIENTHLALSADGGSAFSDNSFKTITRISSAGSTNFTISGMDLNSAGLATVDFTPIAGAPVITSLNPTATTTSGGAVLVNGSNFAPGALVRIGQMAPLAATFISTSQLQVTLPSGLSAQSAMDVVVTNPNSTGPQSQQQVSGILRGAFSVQLEASQQLTTPLVASMGSNGVTFIDRRSLFTAIAQNPLHEVQGAAAVTANGRYIFTPVSGDQINPTTIVNGGVAVTDLTNGTTSFIDAGASLIYVNSMFLIPSIDPATATPVMYLSAPNTAANNLVLSKINADTTSASFGALSSVSASESSTSGALPLGLAATPDGRYVYAGYEDGFIGLSTYHVNVFDMSGAGALLGSFVPTSVNAAATQRLLTITADGHLLMVGSASAGNIVNVYDITTPTSPVQIETITLSIPAGRSTLSIGGMAMLGNTLYVSGYAADANGSNRTNVLEVVQYNAGTSTFDVVNSYSAAPLAAYGLLSLDADGVQLYLTATSADQVQIFDTAKLASNDASALVATIGTPFGPTKFVANTAGSVPTTDIQLAMNVAPNPAPQGGTVTYSFTISNNGPLAATNVVFQDNLPGGTVPVSQPAISCSGATCSCNNAAPVVCSVSSIPVGGTVTGTIAATVPGTLGDFANTAQVVADQASASTSNSISVGGSTVPGADLAITSFTQPTAPAVIGTDVTYTLVVHNNGPDAATGVTLSASPGANPIYLGGSSTTSQGACTPSTPFSCSLGNLGAGATVTITVTGNASKPGRFTTIAAVTANELDPTTANNTASQTTVFLPSATGVERYIVSDRQDGRLRQFSVADYSEVPPANEPVPGLSPNSIAVMPNGRTAFVTSASNYVSVVDFTLGSEIARIPGRGRTLALNADSSRLFISEGLSDELLVVDTATFAVVSTISYNGLVGDNPATADVAAGAMVVVGSKVYLSAGGLQFNSSSYIPIIVIDTMSQTVSTISGTETIRGFGNAAAMVATPDGHYIVAARSSAVFLIDATSDTLSQTVSNSFTAGGPNYMAITKDANDPRGFLAYMTTSTRTNVLDLRAGSSTFGQFLLSGTGLTMPFAVTTAALSADGSRAFFSGTGIGSLTANEIAVVDTATLVSNPAASIIGQYRISDFLNGNFSAVAYIDNAVPAGAPVITSASPNAATFEQDATVVVHGSNFTNTMKVRINKLDLIAPTSATATDLQITVPAGSPAGIGDIAVIDMNGELPVGQRAVAARLPNAFTIHPPVGFAPQTEVVGHLAGEGSVLQIGRIAQQSYVGQIALESGAVSPDGSTYWMPTFSGILPFDLDTHAGTINTNVPHPSGVNGSISAIDPVTGKQVTYLSHTTGTLPRDPELLVIDAETTSGSFGQVLTTRTIPAGLNDNSNPWNPAVTPNGQYVYTITSSGKLVIYNVAAGTATNVACTTYSLLCTGLTVVRVSPDGQYLIAHNTAGGLSILGLSNPLAPTLLGTLTPAIPSGFTSISLDGYIISNSNRVFATDTADGVLEVFQIDGLNNPVLGTYVAASTGDLNLDNGLAITPDESMLYVGLQRSGVVRVLDPAKIISGDPNPVIATLQTGVFPSGLNMTTRAVTSVDLSAGIGAPTYVGLGGNLVYTITVTNNSVSNATGVVVVDTLYGATFVSSSAACAGSATVTCSLGTVPPGATSFTITAQAPLSPVLPDIGPPLLHNQATVSGNENDPDLNNNTATADTQYSQACAPFDVYNKAWIGGDNAGPHDWSNAANWSPAGAPASTDNVFVCAGPTAAPVLSANAPVGSLLLENAASLDLNGFTLTASGSVNAPSPIIGGTLAMAGNATTLQGTVPNLNVTGAVTLAGATNVNGALSLTGGNLDIASYTATVSGDYSASYIPFGASSNLIMNDPAGVLSVAGNFTSSGSTVLTAGVLALKGKLTTLGGYPFVASGSHTVQLTGTAAQLVTFNNGSLTGEHFQNLQVSNTAGVDFASNFAASGNVSIDQAIKVDGAAYTLAVGGDISSVAASTLQLNTLQIAGHMNIAGVYSVGTTTFTGTGPQPIPALAYQNIGITGSTVLAADVHATGSLSLTGGDLDISSHTATIDGNYSGSYIPFGPSGNLIMNDAAGVLAIGGSFSTSAAAQLTAGVLQVARDFTTLGGYSFSAGGTSTVQMLGHSGVQNLSLANPDGDTFQNLQISNTAGVNLASNATLLGDLTLAANVPFTGAGTLSAANVNTAAGSNLQLAGVQASGALNIGGTYAVGTTTFSGSGPQSIPSLPYQDISITGDTVLAADISASGSLSVNGGGFDIAAHTANIAGSVTASYIPFGASGRISMNNGAGVLNVGGDFTSSASVQMSAGRLQVAGNFTTQAGYSFASSGSHTVLLDGSGAQTVTLANAGETFQNLEITNTTGSISLAGQPTFAVNGNFSTAAPITIFGNGRNLSVGGFSALGLTLDGATLNISGVIGNIDGLRFQNVTGSVPQLSISQSGGTYTFRHLTFQTPYAGPLVSATDTNPTDGNVFTVNLQSTLPLNGSSQTVVSNAVVNWTGNVSDLAISAAAATPVLFGNDVSNTFTITNNGPEDAYSLTFTAPLPSGTSLVSANSGTMTCGLVSTAVSCTLPSLAAGASASVTIAVHPSAVGTVINTASVSNVGVDSVSANNMATVSTNVTASADISITAVGSPLKGAPGQNVTYTLYVANAGPSDATGVVLTDSLPAGVTFTSASASNAAPCSASTSISCALGSIPAGSGVSIVVVAHIVGTGTLTNLASVSATETDTVPANNSATAVTTSLAADLAVSSVFAGSAGGASTYNVQVSNAGPSPASSVTVTVTLSRFTVVSFSNPAGTCASTATTLTCPIGNLPVNGTQTVTLSLKAPSGGWASVVSNATASEFDPNPVNNSAELLPASEGLNTSTGSVISVNAGDSGGDALVTFSQVTAPGNTALTTLPLASAPPPGFRAGAAAIFYDLTSTAQFIGPVNVTFRFTPAAFRHPSRLRLFHMENGVWVDRTAGVNPATGTVSGAAMSLSPFALFEPVNAIPVAAAGDVTVPGASTTGAAVTLDGSASADADGDPLTYRWAGPFAEGATVSGPKANVTLPVGTSRVTLVVNDGEADSAPVAFNVTVSDFLVAASSASATVQGGAAATYTIAVAPQFGAFNAPVTLGCANVPAGMACSFSPSTVTPGANGAASTLTLTTSRLASTGKGPLYRQRGWAWIAITFAPFGFVVVGGVERKRIHWLMLGMLLALLIAGVGCGGGGGNSVAAPAPAPAHSATTSTVTVTATSAGITHSVTLTVTVQ